MEITKQNTTNRSLDLLIAVEQIVEKANGSGLCPEFYRKANRHIKYVAEKMELSREQAIMMALFINNSHDTRIHLRGLEEFLGGAL